MFLLLKITYLYVLISSVCFSYQCSAKSLNSSKFDEKFIPRVVNGWPAALGDVPYQIAFKGSTMEPFSMPIFKTFCGGSIIAPTKILSAAHCFVPDGSDCLRLFVKIGHIKEKELRRKIAVAGTLLNEGHKPSTDDTPEGQWRALRDVFFPKRYRFPKQDIAIIFTTEAFKFNDNVSPIPFASRYADYHGKCLASGYGRTSTYGVAKSDKLLLAHLEITPTSYCNRHHKRNMRDFVCTSSAVTDIGKGDSGGPLVCTNTKDPNEGTKGILVGIASGHRFYVGTFFTRVSSYYKFVQSNRSSGTCRSKVFFVPFIMLIKNYYVPFCFGFICCVYIVVID